MIAFRSSYGVSDRISQRLGRAIAFWFGLERAIGLHRFGRVGGGQAYLGTILIAG